MQELPEDEGWSGEIWLLIRNVANGVGARESSADPLMRVVCQIGLDMIDRRFEDFFFITAHATPGTPYSISLSFRADKFRRDLTTATLERLRRSSLTSSR